MKLWLRITVTITTLSVIAAGLMTFFVNDKVRSNLDTAYYDLSNTLSRAISQSVLGHVLEGNVSKTQDILRRIIRNSHDIEYIIVVDFSNELFASTLDVSNIPISLKKMNHAECTSYSDNSSKKHSHDHEHNHNIMHLDDKAVDYMHNLVNNLGGHIHIGLKNSIVKNTQSAIEQYSITIAVLVSVLGFMVAIFLSKKISSPIEELSKVVSDFGKTGLSKEIDITTSDKDILKLIENFSSMSNDRAEYEEEISSYKFHLEELVKERTRQLEIEIEEHENTEKELIEEKKISDKANKSKSDFLSHMSHELRTPLNAVLGFSQLLAAEDDEETKDYANEIMKAGGHLLSLVNDILDLSKIEAGKLDFSIEDISWNTVIEECYVLLENIADEKSININLNFDENIEYIVKADRVRLKQSTLNLMSNAIKYNMDSGTVTISFDLENDILRMSVKDMGKGIAIEQQEKLFTPFQRLDMGKVQLMV